MVNWVLFISCSQIKLCNLLIKLPLSNCSLLQAQLGNVTVNDAVLVQETAKICNVAMRLTRSVYEFAKIRAIELGEAFFPVLVNVLTLHKCLNVRLWENSPGMLGQLPKIGPVSVKAFAAAGIRNFEELAGTCPRDIEKVRNAGGGID